MLLWGICVLEFEVMNCLGFCFPVCEDFEYFGSMFLEYEPSEIFGVAEPRHEVLEVFRSLCHEWKVTECLCFFVTGCALLGMFGDLSFRISTEILRFGGSTSQCVTSHTS